MGKRHRNTSRYDDYEDMDEQEALRRECMPVDALLLPQWAVDAIGLADDARRQQWESELDEVKEWERRL